MHDALVQISFPGGPFLQFSADYIQAVVYADKIGEEFGGADIRISPADPLDVVALTPLPCELPFSDLWR